MKPILEIKGLTVRFDSFDKSIYAIDDVDLQVCEGEFLGVVGSAGSGKSVLLKSIINLVPNPGFITNGKVLFNGQDLLSMSEEKLRLLRGKEIGLILSDPRSQMDPLVKIKDLITNVVLSHNNVERKIAYDMALEILRKVEINDPERRMNSYAHELSIGMAQRVIIGMALINSPKLILADEPTRSLDVTIQRQVMDLLATLVNVSKFTTIIVSRDFGIIANYCHRIAVMCNGKIVEVDYVRTFFKRAQHPVSLQLLGTTFAAKGQQKIKNKKAFSNFQSDIMNGKLHEVEPGHLVRISSREE